MRSNSNKPKTKGEYLVGYPPPALGLEKLLARWQGRGSGFGDLFLRRVRRHSEMEGHAELRQLHGSNVAARGGRFENQSAGVRRLGLIRAADQEYEAGTRAGHFRQ